MQRPRPPGLTLCKAASPPPFPVTQRLHLTLSYPNLGPSRHLGATPGFSSAAPQVLLLNKQLSTPLNSDYEKRSEAIASIHPQKETAERLWLPLWAGRGQQAVGGTTLPPVRPLTGHPALRHHPQSPRRNLTMRLKRLGKTSGIQTVLLRAASQGVLCPGHRGSQGQVLSQWSGP